MTRVDEMFLPRVYKTRGHGIVSDEIWDETAEDLQGVRTGVMSRNCLYILISVTG